MAEAWLGLSVLSVAQQSHHFYDHICHPARPQFFFFFVARLGFSGRGCGEVLLLLLFFFFFLLRPTSLYTYQQCTDKNCNPD